MCTLFLLQRDGMVSKFKIIAIWKEVKLAIYLIKTLHIPVYYTFPESVSKCICKN